MSENNKDNKFNKQGFFKVHKAEFKKITWPSRKVLLKQTINVILILIIVGIIIFIYDIFIQFLLDKLIQFMS